MGGVSGGSHGSNTIDYPGYIKDLHEDLIGYFYYYTTKGDIGPNSYSPLQSLLGANPFYLATAYDPSTELTQLNSALATLYSALNTLDSFNLASQLSYYSSYFTAPTSYSFATLANLTASVNVITAVDQDLLDETHMNNLISAFHNSITNMITNDLVPKYRRGMQNLNAEMTSAYSVGEARLYSDADLKVTEYEYKLRTENENRLLELQRLIVQNNANYLKYEEIKSTFNSNLIQFDSIQSKFTLNQDLIRKEREKLSVEAGRIDFQKEVSLAEGYIKYFNMYLDKTKISIIANKEEKELNYAYDEKYAKWYGDCYQILANMIGSIAGTAVSSQDRSSVLPSALGGLASGAGAGFLIGGPVGAAVGGSLGFIGGLLG